MEATENKSIRLKPKWFWLGVVFCAGVPVLFGCFAEYAAVSPWGSEKSLWYDVFLFTICLIVLLLLIAISLVLIFLDRFRQLALLGFVCVVALIGGLVARAMLGNKIRTHGFVLLAERSAPLVEAIKKYEQKNSQTPESLEALVPDFIPRIPFTGMGAYPKYEYVTGEKSKDYDGNPWVLSVFTPSGGINFDQFLYFPLQNYPKTGYGGTLERIGAWAYVHE